ncbi:hypothetical protein [Eubacterium sp. An11]|nr:hypothetical protein [Eubacterium sp. An11]
MGELRQAVEPVKENMHKISKENYIFFSQYIENKKSTYEEVYFVI